MTFSLSRLQRFRLAIVLCAFVVCVSSAAAADSRKESTRLTAEAESILDVWLRDEKNLEKARALLDRAVELTPDFAEAYRQYARAHIRSSELEGSSKKEALGRAEQALDRALEIDPKFGNAFVLRGYLFRLQGRPDDAWSALDEAERLRASDPWLPLTRADLMKDKDNHAQALPLCKGVAKRHRKDARLLDSAQLCMIESHQRMGQLDEAEAIYKSRVKGEQKYGHVFGNYAYFLLCRRNLPEEALKTARAGMQLPSPGQSRLIYLASLYHAWAQEQIGGSGKDAEQFWKELEVLSVRDPSELMQMACGMQATRLVVLRALRDTQRAQLVPPMFAVMATAERAPKAFQAAFVMEVKGGAMVGDESFINSEEDYRDPRTLVVRFPPDAVAAFADEHGQPPNEFLIGKTITVVGYAQKRRIDFTTDGLPTGKYYFQTQITITESWQVREFVPKEEESEEPLRPVGI